MNWQILDKETIWALLPRQVDRIGYANAFVTLLGGCNMGGATWWGTSTAHYSNGVRVVGSNGDMYCRYPDSRGGAACLALPFYNIMSICKSAASVQVGEIFESSLEYPQNPVVKGIEDELDKRYSKLKRTGRTYTVDSVLPTWKKKYYNKNFKARTLEEVEYKGRRYVRMKALLYSDNIWIKFDGKYKQFNQGQYYFVEVAKVHFKRICDKSGKEWALPYSKDGRLMPLFAGVQVDLQKRFAKYNYGSGTKMDISKHNLGRYMQRYFIRDIEQSITQKR